MSAAQIEKVKDDLRFVESLFRQLLKILPEFDITDEKILPYGLKPHTRSISWLVEQVITQQTKFNAKRLGIADAKFDFPDTCLHDCEIKTSKRHYFVNVKIHSMAGKENKNDIAAVAKLYMQYSANAEYDLIYACFGIHFQNIHIRFDPEYLCLFSPQFLPIYVNPTNDKIQAFTTINRKTNAGAVFGRLRRKFTEYQTLRMKTDLETLLDRVLNEDAVEGIAKIPDNSIDLVVSDPPYCLGKDYGNDSDKLDPEKYLKWSKQWINAVVPKLKSTGSLYIFLTWRYSPEIFCYLKKKLTMLNEIIGTAGSQHGGQHAAFSSVHDNIGFFAKAKDYYFNIDAIRIPYDEETKKARSRSIFVGSKWLEVGYNPKDLWSVSRLHRIHSEREDHPTQKPLEIIERMIKASCPFTALCLILSWAADNGGRRAPSETEVHRL